MRPGSAGRPQDGVEDAVKDGAGPSSLTGTVCRFWRSFSGRNSQKARELSVNPACLTAGRFGCARMVKFRLPHRMVNCLKRSAAHFYGAGEFGVMRNSATLIVAAFLAVSGTAVSGTQASATMRISDDIGGRIGAYVDQYSAVRNSGE